MDNTFRLPGISGPMMTMGSSPEGREGARPPAPQHVFSGQGLDKDHSGGPPGVSFSAAGIAMYRGDHGFAPPLYAPLPPAYVRSGMGLISAGGGAFRHLGPHEGAESYHSAFTPAKKTKLEETACANTYSDNHDFDKDAEGSRKSGSPSVKEERPSSISSTGGDTNSEIHSDNGDLYECGTPDSEGRSLRKSRKRPVDGHICCPVCGLTLRPGETETHLAVELDKLERICRGRKSRDSTPSGRKTLPSPSGRKGKDSPSLEAAQRTRYETYRKIHENRQSRLAARNRNKKRRVGEETVCPVCSDRLTGSLEELSTHVELCLKKQRHGGEEEQVDVEGDGGDNFEEYTWAGQTRVRATTMLEGGFAGQGFQTSSSKRGSEDEGDLNVDGDDSEQYGNPQFCESDLIRLRPDDAASTSTRQDQVRIKTETATREATPGCSQSDVPLDLCRSELPTSTGQGALILSLKARLKELEQSQDAKQKCLICMTQYQGPLVSIQCWHVHCEQCWFQTLGAKKLCPQCNMITSPADLRRIFL